MHDIEIRPAADGSYEIIREGVGVIGRTGSEQEAMVLACGERQGARVTLIERETARRVAVDCPAESPLENFGEMKG